jgi:NAD+ kinase
MKVAIFGQAFYPDSIKYLIQMLSVFKKRNVNYVFEEQYFELIQQRNVEVEHTNTFKTLDNSFDLFFSLGGDGTILASVNYVRNISIPIVGINTGRLGFLATIHKDNINSYINDILDGKYSISKRSVLEVTSDSPSFNSDFNFALNEVTLCRKDTTSMISIDAWVEEEHVGKYWSDGLIISTPTGSTGYSLSCGGPIISPQTKALVLTPIAPHNLNARPLVVPDDSKLKLKVSGREKDFLLSMDSRINTVSQEYEVFVQKANFEISLALHKDNSFIKTLRKKLLWGEDQRN